MNISLTPQLERLFNQRVKSGASLSASEVVRESLRLLQERDRMRELRYEDLRKELHRGMDQLERGEGTSVGVDQSPKYMKSLIARANARLQERRKRK